MSLQFLIFSQLPKQKQIFKQQNFIGYFEGNVMIHESNSC